MKFRDVELIGTPTRVTIGKKGLAEGMIERTDRATGGTTKIALTEWRIQASAW